MSPMLWCVCVAICMTERPEESEEMIRALESELMAFMVLVAGIQGLFGVVCTMLDFGIGHMITSFDFRHIA